MFIQIDPTVPPGSGSISTRPVASERCRRLRLSICYCARPKEILFAGYTGMEKVTYTPAEFAKLFGKERTWAYRLLYKGKIVAVTEYGRTMIPGTEVEKIVGDAGRYLGANARARKPGPAKSGKKNAAAPQAASSADHWREAIMRRRKRGQPRPESARSGDGRKPASPTRRRPCGPSSAKQSVYQRLTRYKS